MHILIIALVAVVLLASPGFAPARSSSAGIGVGTCGQFPSEYAGAPDYVQTLYFTWAQGFMSGTNTARVLAKLGSADLFILTPEEQMARLRSFCDEHPLKAYEVGVVKLYLDLLKKTQER